MTQRQYIKELREKEEATIADIARRLNICWSTAKKYADEPADFTEKPKQRRKQPVLEPVREIVDGWVEEDQIRHRKHRHTAKRIYNRLRRENEYQGSYETIRDYVRQRKKELQRAKQGKSDQFVRLEHPCGEAQVDFGSFKALDPTTHAVTILHHLVMAFPNSNARYARILPAQNGECLFFGLTEIFQEIGGVPPFILFDNLTPVVKEIVSRSERKLTDAFLDFRRRFGFAYLFAAPGAGEEKGCAESAVGYIRRNFLVPELTITDYDAANAQLQQQLQEDRKSLHYQEQIPIQELWKDDAAVLLPLPEVPYAPVRSLQRTVNKYGEIKIGKEIYHIPQAHVKQAVFLQLSWDTVHVYDSHGDQALATLPRAYVQKTEAINWRATLAVYRNKPRGIEQARHLQALPQSIREFLLPQELAERRQRVQAVIALLETYELDMVQRILEQATAYDVTSLDELRMLGELLHAADTQAPLPEPWSPLNTVDWNPDLGAYDALTPRRRSS